MLCLYYTLIKKFDQQILYKNGNLEMKTYDKKDKNSILKYTKQLDNKTVNQVIDEYIDTVNEQSTSYMNDLFTENTASFIGEDLPTYGTNTNNNKKYKGKGGFGNYLEEVYFGKPNDNESKPDFDEAGIELKTSPLKFLKNGEIRVKERLVLNHFTYRDIAKETFENSHFLKKDSFILLVFYFYDQTKELGDLKISFSDFWKCMEEDSAQIKEDWQTIVTKIKAGKAHELSEGDTLYLGACTKGATAASSMQDQPNSDIKARGRALCFKTNYINIIYRTLKDRQNLNQKQIPHLFLNKEKSFKEQVIETYRPYLGLSSKEIGTRLNLSFKDNFKSQYAYIARNILGLKQTTKNIFEFEASGLQLKTIRVEPNYKIKESISFPAFDYCEILEEEVWENSTLYNQITSQFIFVLFKHNSTDDLYYLDKVIFWHVPTKDFDLIESVWKDTKKKIEANNYDNFIKIKNKRKVHIRPHDRNSKNKTMSTPQGEKRSRVSFWLNNNYIKEEVIDKTYNI